ncbi:hypothetical protein [Paenibacillus sp. Marseille-Q4541]|uniref:hypothetical protein n=1 Tax=Paenibacillus sp. Marseille-Q4541 TaxID=2831522 RepID=UPI001BA68427|nr:hypothetical protein [Paenibacillus sp. Marseille-Q4541]
MIGTSRFYCVACKRILWGGNESMNYFNSSVTEASGDALDGSPLSRKIDPVSPTFTANLIFRTGFYRNEMPLGYCGHCREVHHTKQNRQSQQQTCEQESEHPASLCSWKKDPVLECGTGSMVH